MKLDPRHLPDGSYCCGGEPHRGHLCQYHEGWDDGHEAAIGELLTQDEQGALSVSAELAGLIHRVIGDGLQSRNDWSEAAAHLHALQHMVMAQAAARAYPGRFRPLGQSWPTKPLKTAGLSSSNDKAVSDEGG